MKKYYLAGTSTLANLGRHLISEAIYRGYRDYFTDELETLEIIINEHDDVDLT